MDLSAVPTPTLERLAETLWAERLATERLLYRLTTAKLLLAAEEERFVPRAVDEVGAAAARLDEMERRRLRIVGEAVAAAGSAGSELRLRDLAAGTSGPWPRVFDDLHAALVELAADVEATAEATRELAGDALARQHHARTTLTAACPPAAGAVVVPLDRGS